MQKMSAKRKIQMSLDIGRMENLLLEVNPVVRVGQIDASGGQF